MMLKRKFKTKAIRICILWSLLALVVACSKTIELESLNKKYKATVETQGVPYKISENDLGIRNVWLRLSMDEVVALAELRPLNDQAEYLKLGIHVGHGKDIPLRVQSEYKDEVKLPYVLKDEGEIGHFLVKSISINGMAYSFDLFPLSEKYAHFRLWCASNFSKYKKGGNGQCTVNYIKDNFLKIDYLIDFDYLDDFESFADAVEIIISRHIKQSVASESISNVELNEVQK